MTFVSSYDRNAPRPKVGSRWVWEIDKPAARCLIEVTKVAWNGEEWWVTTKNLTADSYALPPTLLGSLHGGGIQARPDTHVQHVQS